MSAKRCFQLAFVWPNVLPIVVLVLPGSSPSDWIQQVSRATVSWAGIPYALFAAAMILWSWSKDADADRRSTYLATVLFLPVLGVGLLIVGMLKGPTYGVTPAELIILLFIYGLVLMLSELTLGYSYVALINLVFVAMRSLGAFETEEWVSTIIPQSARQPFDNRGTSTFGVAGFTGHTRAESGSRKRSAGQVALNGS